MTTVRADDVTSAHRLCVKPDQVGVAHEHQRCVGRGGLFEKGREELVLSFRARKFLRTGI